MINTLQTSPTGTLVEVSVIKPVSTSVKETETTKSTTSSDATNISLFARQLSESSARAEKRDSSMSRAELGALSLRIEDRLVGEDYHKNITKHNAEVPSTDDLEWQARARKATEYLTLKFSGDYTGKNPFLGLPREQVAAIAYDEKGPYTVNERRAAWSQLQQMESDWRMKVVTESSVESASNNGKTPKFYTELLAHYRSLPPIEQAQYPEDYEARLQTQIDEAESGQESEEFEPLTLLQILLRLRQPENEAKKPDETETAPEPTTSNLSPDASPTPAAVPRS